mgnify:CR=1 FL=1
MIAHLYHATEKAHISVPRKAGGVLVGRSSSCDIKITGGDISLTHFHLLLATNETGRELLYLTDMSLNGTYVNGELVGRSNSTLLRSGDRVGLARSHTYVFRYAVDEGSTKLFFDDYVLGTQLGLGHYAVVKEARNRKSGEVVAVKVFRKAAKGLQQELALLVLFLQPNIVRCLGYYLEPEGTSGAGTYLVLQKVGGGELFQRIVDEGRLGINESRAIFGQLLQGVKYLHKNGVIHRDIKPENVLLDITPRLDPLQPQTGPWDPSELNVLVKLADFGLAKFVGEIAFTRTLCGTPAYVAPEVLAGDRKYTTKADIWLLGVLLYVCLCGFPPFCEELGPPAMKEQILTGRYAFYSPYWDHIEDLVLDLILALLAVEPGERYDIDQTLKHQWIAEADDSVNVEWSSSEDKREPELESMNIDTQRLASMRSDLGLLQPITLREASRLEDKGSKA